MVAEVKNQQKLTRANSLKEKKTTKASLDHAAARVVKKGWRQSVQKKTDAELLSIN